MKKRNKHLLWSVSLFLVLFFGLQRLLVPKYITSAPEGRLIGEYYTTSGTHQVLFIGDCEVYENYSPITFWENCGITSYIRGGPQQLLWQSYYILEDTLRYETPEVVVLNVMAMKYDTPQSEPYNRLNLEGLAWSSSKWNGIMASMTEEEHIITYILPFFRYHERILELSLEDFTSFFQTPTLSHNGYVMHTGVKPVTVVPTGDFLATTEYSEISYEYLDKITQLCKKNGISLVLVKAPSIYPYFYEEWDRQMEDYSREHNLMYLNFLHYVDEIGIDYEEDTYDGGLHLNVYGAEKLSAYLAPILQEQFALEDLRTEGEISSLWEEKVKAYVLEKKVGGEQ